MLGLTQQEGWTLPTIRRLVSSGYNAETIVNIISAMPRSIKDAINQGLISMSGIVRCSMSHSDQIALSYDMKVNEAVNLLMSGDTSRWMNDTRRSIRVLSFDPATQCPTSMFANPCTQYAFGMHLEEFLSRSAAYDRPLGMADLDFVRLFLDVILAGVGVPLPAKARYIRSTSGPNASRSYVLMLWCSFAVLGPDSRVVEASSASPCLPVQAWCI